MDTSLLSSLSLDTSMNINTANFAKNKASLENLKNQVESSDKSNQKEGKKSEYSDSQIKKASEDFEAMLLSQMLNSMWKTIPKNDLWGNGREEDYFREMLNDEISHQISQGDGLGIKDLVQEELDKRG